MLILAKGGYSQRFGMIFDRFWDDFWSILGYIFFVFFVWFGCVLWMILVCFFYDFQYIGIYMSTEIWHVGKSVIMFGIGVIMSARSYSSILGNRIAPVIMLAESYLLWFCNLRARIRISVLNSFSCRSWKMNAGGVFIRICFSLSAISCKKKSSSHQRLDVYYPKVIIIVDSNNHQFKSNL